ncbi:MAG: carboxypeptidase-like regulatory domain-containing protein, partial [Flavobacteriales bacterium]|nr:carboxypeptidase-like regulatory domain-containing protein [Flavobacteriales bacterium]
MLKFSYPTSLLKKLFAFTALIVLAAFTVDAQVVIKGIVKDDITGETMIGSAVIIKGTSIGSVTDIDGKFEFVAPDSPPFTLVVSFLGYTSQEIL